MATKREASVKNIIDMFTRFSQKVMLHNAISYQDINKSSEALFMGVLNRIYPLNLKNMNAIQTNYPAIDLGDEDTGVCYQVTSSGTNEKYIETISKFNKKELGKKFRELRFLIIGESKITKKDPILRTKVYTLKDLIRDIDDMPDSALSDLENYLKIQLDEKKQSGSILPAVMLAPDNSESIEKFLDYHRLSEEEKYSARSDMKEFMALLRTLTNNQREFIYHVASVGHFRNATNRNKGDTTNVYMTEATLRETLGRSTFQILQSLEDLGIAHWDDEYYKYSGANPTGAVSLRFYNKCEDFNLIAAVKDFANGDNKILFDVLVNTSTIDLA